MKHSNGFSDPNYPQPVCKRKHTLYGIMQAARSFYEVLTTALGRSNLIPFRTDSAVFYGVIDDSDVWVIAYVDNLLITSKKIRITDILKEELEKGFFKRPWSCL